ncbi:MAG: amidohydrolase family protein [Dehalococcoidia bacterium]|nr:amidohydrolase family protein [Dehalococcoidia bacterium]
MIKPIDVWFNAWPKEAVDRLVSQPEIANVLQIEKLDFKSPTPEEAVSVLDEAGVEIAFLTSLKQGFHRRMRPGMRDRMVLDVSHLDLLPFLQKYPNRFRGLYGINPWLMMDGVRELESAVKEHGFVGAVSHVAGFAPFNDKIWYPFYAKCAELDIPIITQAGHFGEFMPEGAAHPLLIDDVALDFPELRIVAGHTGWPWCDELIAVALKDPNVYISVEAHLPKYYEPSLVRYINSRGQDKVMWGTDWPVTEPKRNLYQLEQLGLREEPKRKLLRDNTVRVFKLKL